MTWRALFACCAAVVLCACRGESVEMQETQKTLQLIGSEPVRDRITDLTFRTALVDRDVHVRVMVPTAFDSSGHTRYPVLYLLHGAGGDHTAWTEGQQAGGAQGQLQDQLAEGTATSQTEEITKDAAIIVVMPESGTGGGYIDWYNNGAFGSPAWESYHIGQLLPWIDAHYPTLGTREGRAVAGFSMGGYGALVYAARHPDLFIAAAGFSPDTDKTDPLVVVNNSRGDPQATVVDQDQDADGSLVTNMVYIRGHNPMDLAENLAFTALTLRCGNGAPGAPPPVGDGSNRPDPVEAGVFDVTTRFHQQLAMLGIPHVFATGAGAHTRSFAEKYLGQSLPWLLDVFAFPPPAPERITHRSIEPVYSLFGWTVQINRTAREFSELRDAGRDGFSLSGSGSAMVSTPRGRATPRSKVRATVHNGSSQAVLHLIADDAGRVVVPVDLGPANPYDEYSAEAAAGGFSTYTANVDLVLELQ